MIGPILLILTFLFIGLFVIRYNWVHNVRMSFIKAQDGVYYNRLPSGDRMIWSFWIWDPVKFIDYKLPQPQKTKDELYAERGLRLIEKFKEQQNKKG